MMSTRPPDWQLPRGVTPGLWEYLHEPQVANHYLDHVEPSPFAIADQRFVEQQLTMPCRVVDLGCGPGRSILPLAKRGFECTGVDLSDPMLEKAKQKLTEHSLHAKWVQANLGEPLPFADASFDAALCLFGTLGMLHPTEVRSSLLNEVHRILMPQGVLLLHVHNRWPLHGVKTLYSQNSVMTLPFHQGVSNLQMKLFTVPEIKDTLAQAGFVVDTLEYITASDPHGRYKGSRWLAPFRADGFLLAARPKR